MSERAPAAYQEFLDRVNRMSYLTEVGSQLYWDEQVMMPEGGTPARSEQRSTVSGIRHELLTDDRTGELLDQLDDEGSLSADQAAIVREVRREYEEATRLPDDLTAAMDRAESNAQPKWRAAREGDDYEEFAPALERVVDLRKEYAGHLDPDAPVFEVLFRSGEFCEPYLGFDVAERVMDRLREELVPLLDRIRESDAELATDALDADLDRETQMAVFRDALDVLEFDWEHGRFDSGPYHFSSGNPWDSRVTTQLHDDWVGGLFRTLHEFGHTVNTWGLPKEHYCTPLCRPISHALSESQSRFWENNVGKSRGFWELFLPKLKARLPRFEGVTVEEAYQAANQIRWDNFVRYEADELTYHLHVMVRWDVERELLDGDLAVADVPERWNETMDEYLGIQPETLADGCLQDIHWSVGSISSFQNYTLGSVFAAQLQHAMEADIGDLSERVANGDVDAVREWLHENLHRYGSRYPTDELVEVATGEPFTADYFVEYVTEKYEALYDL